MHNPYTPSYRSVYYRVIMVSITSFLVRLIFFLLPSNLALHWPQADSYISGHLIDYLIPRLYLTDLPIVLVLILNWRKLRPSLIFLPIFIYLVLQTTFISPYSSSIWYVFKLLELVLFLVFLRANYSPSELLNLVTSPLGAMGLIQFMIGLYQYIMQSSLFGYIFLGEVSLGSVSGLAQSSLSGAQRILAYGTTPHPNVLAGFILVVWLLINLKSINNPNRRYQYYPNIFYTGLLVGTILITESVTVLVITLLMSAWFYCRKHIIGNLLIGSLLMICLLSSLVTIMPSTIEHYHSRDNSDFRSLTVRYRLNQYAISLFSKNPLFGHGLNRFPALLIEHNLLTTAPFIQPAHQIYLLLLTELGFAGICILVTCSLVYYRRASVLSVKKRLIGASMVLVSMLLIGLFDHYPLTLQIGQLLLVLSLALL